MDPREWSLILFTVLTQASVGAFLFTLWFEQRSKETAARQAYQRLHGVLIPVMIVALLASLGHLGRPMQALSSLGNLGTSWLSREIFFTGGFFVLLVLMVLLKRNDGVRRVLAWLTGLAGVAAVISMAMIYHMSIMPAWQGYGTFVAFGGTTFFLGAALAAVVLLGRAYQDQARDLRSLAWTAVVVALIEAALVPLQMAALAGGSEAAQATAALLAGPYAWLVILRWALALIVGVVVLLAAIRRLAMQQVPGSLFYVACLAILASEIAGRYLFYATAVPLGIG